ncbi:alpha/beta fold hydrolase [Clostridium massiliamazoniense]|uniref:alpha/beta fold hydrolase n=1 Tax=Clostridium massiliamazoniense TaxID=1347366 RepID=UPI0009FFFAE7|nr:alpha/beta hydrolase [Clostridium massiliamazoniense]
MEVVQVDSEERKELDIGDITLNYYERGSGKTLIFIHGNGLSSKVFKKMYMYFSRFYRVIAIDTRGHGLSKSGNIPYTVNLLSEDFIKFCNIKNIKKTSIIGYSDGGNIALMIAKKEPTMIDKLVVISGNYKAEGVKLWFKTYVLTSKIPLILLKRFSEKARIKLWRLNLMIRDIGIKDEDLASINTPTLVMCAEFDVISKKHTETIHNYIKGSIIKLVEHSTHFNIVSKENSLKIIDKFLKVN